MIRSLKVDIDLMGSQADSGIGASIKTAPRTCKKYASLSPVSHILERTVEISIDRRTTLSQTIYTIVLIHNVGYECKQIPRNIYLCKDLEFQNVQ